MTKQQVARTTPATRRKFLAGAAATAGAASLGFPMIVKAQGPISMRWQSTWPAKDIFHEYALDFAKKVNDMTGGDLKIEVLPAGAVVPAFGLLDAVTKGTLDGGHGVLVYHYGKQNALALWGSGPAFGMDANTLLAWHKYGGGRDLLNKLYASIGANVVSFPYGPMPTQPLGWFKKPITKTDDFKGLKFRTVGISIDVFTGLGAAVNALPGGEIVPAMDRGLLDAAEFNNATSDRILGFADVAKVCMLQSYHQNAEQFEIMFNKTKYDALPEKMRAIIANAVDAASADMTWKAIDRYSQDYIELQTKQNVKFYKTPDSVLQKQLEVFDEARKKRLDNALFQEIEASQKKFAERAVRWYLDTQVSSRMAYNYYFGQKPGRRQEGLTRRPLETPSGAPGWCLFLPGAPGPAQARRGIDSQSDAEDPALRRQGEHLRGPRVLVAHRRAHAAHQLGGVLPLRARRPARVGVRRDDHAVRHHVHDGRRLHPGEERPRARRRAVRVLRARAPRRRSTSRSTSCSSSPGSSRSPTPGYFYAAESWVINEHSNITAEGPPVYPFKTVIPIAGAILLAQGIVEIVRCVDLPQAGLLALARGGRRGGRRRQAEGDGPRQGRGHPRARQAGGAGGVAQVRIRKELWFGFVADGGDPRHGRRLHALGPTSPTVTSGCSCSR